MQKSLPKDFDKYFWDTNTSNLSPTRDSTYIVERLLELGDFDELEWVNKNYSKEEISKIVKNSRRISPKTGNFFSLYYGIPKESLTCMKKRFI
jgi:hypothetical protein